MFRKTLSRGLRELQKLSRRGHSEPGKARLSAGTPVATGVPDVGRGWKLLELSTSSHIARLIARIDEEAHRFAITYHSLLKRRGMLK